MCGRFGLKTTFATLAKLLSAEPVEDSAWGPDYNIAPTDRAPVALAGDGGARRLALFRWGLVPFWAADPRGGARLINARAETIASKPAFRNAFATRRLLVPVSGWYEWQRPPDRHNGSKPKPYWLHQDDDVLLLAGIWERWQDPHGAHLETFAIATTDAASAVRAVHDRMPVILSREAQALWLAKDTPLETLRELMRPYQGALQFHAVARTVNSVRADGPDLIAPLGPGSA